MKTTNTKTHCGKPVSIKMVFSFALAIAILVSATPALAVATWDGDAGDNNWYNPVNWSDDTLPTAIDDIVIPLGTTGAPSADNRVNIATGSIVISASDVWINELRIAASATGELTVNTGGLLSGSAAWFAFYPNSTATATIAGVMDVASVVIGASGQATVTIDDGQATFGQTSIGLGYDSEGTLILDMWDSTSFDSGAILVGGLGEGNFTILPCIYRNNPTPAVSTQDAVLAQGPNSQADVTVNGLWEITGPLVAGVAGHAELDIVATTGITILIPNIQVSVAAAVTADSLLAATELTGNYGSADITVGSPDSRYTALLQINGPAYLGEHGPATLTVDSAGIFNAGDTYLGLSWHDEYDDETNETERVRGSGTITINSNAKAEMENLFIGCEGDGLVELNYGELVVADRIYVARNVGGTGELNVGSDGSASAKRLYIGGGYASGDIEFKQEGSVFIEDGGSVSVTEGITLGRWGSMSGWGFEIDGGFFCNESVFPEHFGNVSLVFDGTGNTLEAASASQGIGVSDEAKDFELSTLRLKPEAELDLMDDFDNTPDYTDSDMVYVDTLILLDASTLRLNGLTLVYGNLVNDGGTIETGGGQLVQMRASAGDINGDGTTNLDDFILLKQNYGTSAGPDSGDLNLDGVVNLDDFIILKQNYGS